MADVPNKAPGDPPRPSGFHHISDIKRQPALVVRISAHCSVRTVNPRLSICEAGRGISFVWRAPLPRRGTSQPASTREIDSLPWEIYSLRRFPRLPASLGASARLRSSSMRS